VVVVVIVVGILDYDHDYDNDNDNDAVDGLSVTTPVLIAPHGDLQSARRKGLH